MSIQLICSKILYVKIEKLLTEQNVSIDNSSPIALVESSAQQPDNKICVVFNPVDYVEACNIVIKYLQNDTAVLTSIAGFINNRYAVIDLKNILYIEAYGSTISCITANEKYILKKKLYFYENSLRPMGFIRINKSQIVNMMNVKEIIPWFNSRLVLVLKNNNELEVSKLYAKTIKEVLDI